MRSLPRPLLPLRRLRRNRLPLRPPRRSASITEPSRTSAARTWRTPPSRGGRSTRVGRRPAGRSPRSAPSTPTATRWCSGPRRGRRRLRMHVVLRVATHPSERADGVRPCARRRMRSRAHADHRRSLRAEARPLSRGRAGARSTVAVGAPATPTPTGRYYVNQRLIAADPERAVGPGRARHLGVLRRAPGVDPGRADRHPRHERPVVDRPRGLARLRSPAERRAMKVFNRPMRERLSSSRPDMEVA